MCFVRPVPALAVVGMLVFSLVSSATIVDSILAAVDTEVILQSDVMSEIGPQLFELRRKAASERDLNRQVEQLVKKALEQSIESKILLRQALLSGLDVEEEQVDAEMQSIKENFKTNQEFLDYVEQIGETPKELREQIRKRILARRMAVTKLREFEKDIIVSESEVAQYYADHKERFERPERVRCRQIFLEVDKTPENRARARARLAALKEELEAGAAFDQLAKLHSGALDAEQGGLIGWITRNTLVKTLDDAAFSLQEGEVSEILETEGGLHLLKVDKREKAGLATLDEARAEIEPLLRSQAAEARYQKWMKELRKRSRVQVFL